MMNYARHTSAPISNRHDLRNLQALLPYLWDYRGRVLLALASLVLAKVANVGIPLLLGELVDQLDQTPLLPVLLLATYGILRIASSAFNELRDVLFARVRYGAMRKITVRTLAQLHKLSLRYHLERKTGAISRDLQRGSASLSSLLNYMAFSLLPVLVELSLVLLIMLDRYDFIFSAVILLCIVAYVGFTIAVSNWRMEHRHRMNQLESQANNEAVDSLLNYETVKYFGNEALEVRRCDGTLRGYEEAAVLSQSSMSLLNFGQASIISLGVTVMMFLAAQRVVDGSMSLGDLVLVNAFLIQLFIPLGFLGIVYRQMKYALADMEQLIRLLERDPEIQDRDAARPLQLERAEVRFERISFAYDPSRPILHQIDFTIPAGAKVAVVGPSGAGKSTLARLLFRFYDVNEGRVTIDGQDLRDVTQTSLRQAIGIVPQDTVLFNESIYYNLSYARADASREEVIEAARTAQIHDFIAGLPNGYDTVVGERGLKLSGGEKQRVAIARAILKRPRIMVFDEATSSLDSHAEAAILEALKSAAEDHTTLVIAHRLSTIVDADEILVLEAGRIVERGTHTQLLSKAGVYEGLWALQQRARAAEDELTAVEAATIQVPQPAT